MTDDKREKPWVSASLCLHSLAPDRMEFSNYVSRGSDWYYIHVSQEVRMLLGHPDADLDAEIAACMRLAELALEAADALEKRRDTRQLAAAAVRDGHDG